MDQRAELRGLVNSPDVPGTVRAGKADLMWEAAIPSRPRVTLDAAPAWHPLRTENSTAS